MSLPPGFLDELRVRTSLSQVVGRRVMWDPRKSNQGRGDFWAPCPFHQEKTASFHVDDKKGYYYCFGCQAKGDAISFLREIDNLGFMEAVEQLARDAGLPVPAPDPASAAREARRTGLADVMEIAVNFYRLQLSAAAGAAARDYLSDKRGLDPATQARWELGFAPPGWQALWDHLTGKGVAPEQIIEAGLAKPSSKGGKPYDVFRNRIMFPIRDGRDRAIAFGARAMDPADSAKYLNSPETPLFDKGRNLYNLGQARRAVGKGQPLVVAEGYMDVIALAEAGFEAAVAPLGTAVTETQLQMLWRIAPEPLIALDGDAAGMRAALRLIDLALPLLSAGQSLRFVLLPEGCDPDDLLRAGGSGAVQAALDAAVPMVELLWRREIEGRVFDSPERRAGLDKALDDRVRLIRDPSIRSHYAQALKSKRWELFRAAASGGRTSGKRRAGRFVPERRDPVATTRASALAAEGPDAQIRMREAVILATAVATPGAIAAFETRFETMPCSTADHAQLRDLVLEVGIDAPMRLHDRIVEVMGPAALEKLHRPGHVAISPAVRKPGDKELAEMTLAEEFAKLEAWHGLTAEIAEAAEDPGGFADESVTWRLGQAAEARNRALRAVTEDKTEYDTGQNGARINRDERDALNALLERINYAKPKR